MNDWSKSAAFYDAILGKQRFVKSAAFIAKILEREKVKNVLELGCGTGLYLAPLKKKGFAIEGLDISKQMLAEAKPIGVPLYRADMSTFEIPKKYDAILCLNSSLILLPNMRAIAKTLKRCHSHLKPDGTLILDLPHHEKEIPESDGEKRIERRVTKDGRLVVHTYSYRKKNKWIEEWHGSIGKHKFTERFEELIYSPEQLEKSLKQQFKIVRIYGSRTGGRFTKNSYRRVYICKAT